MTRISALSPGKWLSETLISVASAAVFFLLDILDVIMCVFFRVLDGFLEGKPSSCYCIGRERIQQEESDGVDGESELSESLNGRKNVFREMGLLRIPTISSREGPIYVGKGKRWSDCGCETCVSWMSNESDLKLHLVVKEQRGGMKILLK